MACAATIAGKRLTATHALTNGVASCIWRLPKSAKGKTIRGTVTLTVHGVHIAKSFAAKIR